MKFWVFVNTILLHYNIHLLVGMKKENISGIKNESIDEDHDAFGMYETI